MIKLLLLTLLLNGCCSLSYPLDGKAVSWCKREKRAQAFCRSHDSKLKEYYFDLAECENGAKAAPGVIH